MKTDIVIVETGKKVRTMAEYIEREALLKEAESRIMWGASAAAVYELIRDAPAADVVPVRHGRWIHTDLAAHWYGKDECSECTYHEHDRRDLSHFNYCPSCGAKMDGGDGNSDMA